MEKLPVSVPVQYYLEKDGQRAGVVLSWEDYQNLQAALSTDPEMLNDLDEAELQVLAEGILSTTYQERLNELLQLNQQTELSASEQAELDHLLEYIDSMNILKARAKYTLQQRQKTTIS